MEHQGNPEFVITPEDHWLMLALIENGYVQTVGFRYSFTVKWNKEQAEKEFLALTEEKS